MGILYLVSTPIGNLEDITIRAIKTLFTVDYIACEDTRRTGILLQELQKKTGSDLKEFKGLTPTVKELPKLVSFYDEVEDKKVPDIIELLENNRNVALVSDSGTPLISDPGFKLVRQCIKQSIKIVTIPGPTSLISALTISGLPTDKFLFLGYLPKKKGERIEVLEYILFCSRPRKHLYTIVAFESPHRLKESLEDIKEVFGDIEIAIAKELTKIHEKIIRGKISELLIADQEFKGEFVIVLPAITA
ncbi:16S rRNA (cytidine(1402)-2'-O)-methyltransferase [Candidatus Gottesmanbacteria bacterium RIFCSPLOWO2_01_FULL_39_12b]|uniref:Ribosomal RNA small subunit methyltransferase I n=1 Tax=Candidatus Gottesmanbacteria bacterium RIFCSPLOWO2_01_FULL_39_12b TaxID=1798388 RepID=A0A1F6AQB2_9BACT|nr:MAG: 16S rRNA (cytidine(1402)-2'-O)-methyltransferase [Candidatus Gottesmanbacteria bacterium RIFCSPLOWO2_01_FULL_39_12b]